jgi:hypothetical protein
MSDRGRAKQSDPERVREFLRRDAAGPAVALAADYLRTVNPGIGDAGVTWGATCLPSRHTLIRINAGTLEVLQIQPTGRVKVWIPSESAALRRRVGGSRLSGHASSADVGVRFLSFADATRAFDDAEFRTACQQQFQAAATRRLPKSDRTSDALTSILTLLVSTEP